MARWSRISDYAEPWAVRVSSNLCARTDSQASPQPRNDWCDLRALLGYDATEDVAERLDLRAALLALPSRQRRTVVLRFLGGLSERETATALGCSPGTVKTHTKRALAKLRAGLEDGQ